MGGFFGGPPHDPGARSSRELAFDRLSRALPAGFADRAELLRRQWSPDDFWLGESPPELAGQPSFDVGLSRDGRLDDRGVFIAAGTGGGKGISLIIPNLITWPGGVFCIDVKGELASITAMRRGSRQGAEGTGTHVRRFLGQEVAVLDPFGEVKGPARAHVTPYNPLSELNPRDPGFIAEVRRIAAALVVSAGERDVHFTEMVQILIAGVIEVVKKLAPLRMQNLVTVRNIMVEGKTVRFLAKLPGGELVKEALGALEAVGEKEGGSFHTTMVRQWAWLADPRMKESVMGRGGFSLSKIVQGGGSVYVAMPVTELATQSRWLRLMLTMGITAKLRQGVYRLGSPQTLFVVDEMPALGPLDILEQGVGYLRGYGVKPVTVVQDLGQLRTLYSQNWQTFLGNAGALVGFSMADTATPELIASRLGQYEFMEETYSESTNIPEWLGNRGFLFASKEERDHLARGGGSKSKNINRKAEPVLRPEEVAFLTSRDMERSIVLPADGRPMFLKRVPYFVRFAAGGWYDTLDNISRIETHLRLLP